jgi:hypothetical protein
LLVRMHLMPMLSYLLASTNPDIRVLGHIIQELFQCHCSPRLSNESTMKSHRHHLGSSVTTFLVQDIKCIPQIFKISLSTTKSWRLRENTVLLHKTSCHFDPKYKGSQDGPVLQSPPSMANHHYMRHYHTT